MCVCDVSGGVCGGCREEVSTRQRGPPDATERPSTVARGRTRAVLRVPRVAPTRRVPPRLRTAGTRATLMGMVVGIALWLCNAATATAASACGNVQIDAGLADDTDIALVCLGVDRARAFFSQYGLHPTDRITIHLRPQGIDKRVNHIGLYDPAEGDIELLTFDRASDVGEVFRSPMTPALYTSFVVHELAHAFADAYFDASAASVLAHEYIAYTAQLATLPASARDAVLANYVLQGFHSLDEISLLYYELDPSAFGVKSYLHYRDLTDGRAFIMHLLDGSIRLSNKIPDWW